MTNIHVTGLKHLLIFICTILISCSKNEINEQLAPQEQTPEALTGEPKLDFSSRGKRYGTDIIQRLFNEAIENDSTLATVTTRLKEAKEMKEENLEAYRTYTQNNVDYWNALIRYTNVLTDSSMKTEVKGLIKTLKEKHANRTSQQDQLKASIDSTERHLQNLEILMKITVTAPMMKNYQRNELPDLQPLKVVDSVLTHSVNEIVPYTGLQE